MKLQFFGAAGTVTGSRTLVTTDLARVLVDCGMFQGHKINRLRNWNDLDVGPLDAVLLTHAHIDHSGWVPALVARGYTGPVYCTKGTAELAKILWPDAGRIQEEDAGHANKSRSSKHSPALPMFTEADAMKALNHIRVVPFDKVLTIGDLNCDFRLAGHILGAASIRLATPERSVLFSGDLGRPDDALMPAPAPPPKVDVVVMESTYGLRSHPTGDRDEQLAEHISRALDRGGMVIIPSFAVGRAQGLLWSLHCLMSSGRIPRVPIFVDSPMATRATEAVARHPELLRLTADDVRQMCENVRFVASVEESKALNQQSGSFILIAASGMLTGGRVLHHIMNRAGEARNLVLFAGFQVAGTRGALMVAGRPHVTIYGKRVKIRCEVAEVTGFSAHADRTELVAWLEQAPEHPRQIILNHGEPEAADAMRLRLAEAGYQAAVASEGVVWDLDALTPSDLSVPADRLELSKLAKRATGFTFGRGDEPHEVRQILRAMDRGEVAEVPVTVTDQTLMGLIRAAFDEPDLRRVIWKD